MKKVRSLSAVIAVALALSAAGCSDTTSTTSKTSEETTAVSEETTEASTEAEETTEETTEEITEETTEETTQLPFDIDTDYFRLVADFTKADDGYKTAEPEKFDDKEIGELAQKYLDDGWDITTADIDADFFYYHFGIYGDYYDSDNCIAYLYRGFEASKVDNNVQYTYECFLIPEDVLTDVLGFTKVSEDGDKVTYDIPDTGATHIYINDSYVYDRSLGAITSEREFHIDSNAVG